MAKLYVRPALLKLRPRVFFYFASNDVNAFFFLEVYLDWSLTFFIFIAAIFKLFDIGALV